MKLKAMILAIGLVSSMFASAQLADASNIRRAESFIGLHEKANAKQLKRLLGVNPRSTPWCGAFVAAVVGHAEAPAGYKMARSWTRYGKSVKPKSAHRGDIVVLRFRGKYHVGFLIAKAGKTIRVLGGNQSNTVRISEFSTSNVVAIRR